jgi:DNA-binding GntR family transcriptional regulator
VIGVSNADVIEARGRRSVRPQLGDEAASYVRDLIMSGQLRSGQFIRPEAIADELGISATPVREALLALRGEGFVHLEPRRGFAVSPLGAEDIRDLFTAQALLAGELAARAARRIADEDLDRLEDLQQAIEKAAKQTDLNAVEDLNWSFHRAINLLAGSPKITQLVGVAVRCVPHRLYASIEGWPKSTAEDHRAVLDAFKRRSGQKSRSAMITHITNAGDLLAKHYEASPAGVAERSGARKVDGRSA